MTSSCYRKILMVVSLVLTGCATTPPGQDPVVVKQNEMDERLKRVERVVNNESLVQLAAQIDDLQTEVRQLRGEIDNVSHETEGGATRQRDQYLDIDRRLQVLEMQSGGSSGTPAAVVASGAGGAAVARAGATGTSDRVQYQAAFDLLKEGRYEEARKAFEQFLTEHPESQLAGHGQYWFAETYYVGQNFDAALPAFEKVIEGYPSSRKIPDALLKIGYCHYELEQWSEARTTLTGVTENYPETTAARLARQRLAQMQSEER
jgi:tol-pal system protein YbgF